MIGKSAVVTLFVLFVFIDFAIAVDIYNEDAPFTLNSRCVLSNPNDADDLKEAGGWSPAKWELEDSSTTKYWSPDIAGVRINNEGEAIVRFMLSASDIKTMSMKFPNTETRIPFALEIDVTDYDGAFGEKAKDQFSVHSDSVPDEARLEKDIGAYDSINQMSAIIFFPNKLKPNKVYQIRFKPDKLLKNSGEIKLSFQLTVNYKYIAAMRNNSSSACDILDLMGYFKDSDLNGYMLVSGNYGSVPEKALNPWYYYLAAITDSTYKISFQVGRDDNICWDDRYNESHNSSSSQYCGPLFGWQEGDYYDENKTGPSLPILPDNQGNIGFVTPGFETPATDSPDPGKPDFVVTKTIITDTSDHEKYNFNNTDQLRVHSYSKNIGDADWYGDADDIYVPFYLSKGYKEDSHSEWIRLGREQIRKGNLNIGDTKHEYITVNLAILNNGQPLAPGVYNIVGDVDRKYDEDNGDGEVPEKHKSNNRSKEAVFIVFEPNLTLTDLTAPKAVITLGETVRFQAITTNNGGDTLTDTKLSWFISNGNSYNNPILLKEDNILKSNLESGETKVEELFHTFNNRGIFTISTFTDSANSLAEKDEADNWRHLTVQVVGANDDSDGDGLKDIDELTIYNTYPDRSDSDLDGLSDWEELNLWGDDWNQDLDGDGAINILDRDSDGDGVDDFHDKFPADRTESKDFDGDGIGDNSDPDKDGNGILDINQPKPGIPSGFMRIN